MSGFATTQSAATGAQRQTETHKCTCIQQTHKKCPKYAVRASFIGKAVSTSPLNRKSNTDDTICVTKNQSCKIAQSRNFSKQAQAQLASLFRILNRHTTQTISPPRQKPLLAKAITRQKSADVHYPNTFAVCPTIKPPQIAPTEAIPQIGPLYFRPCSSRKMLLINDQYCSIISTIYASRSTYNTPTAG